MRVEGIGVRLELTELVRFEGMIIIGRDESEGSELREGVRV